MRRMKFIRLMRSAFAVLAGAVIALIAALATVAWLPTLLLRETVYTLIGGLAAGYIARRHGWAHGLLSAVVIESCLLAFDMWAFSWAHGPSGVLMVRLKDWHWNLMTLSAGALGGFAGELLARVRRIVRARREAKHAEI